MRETLAAYHTVQFKFHFSYADVLLAVIDTCDSTRARIQFVSFYKQFQQINEAVVRFKKASDSRTVVPMRK